MFTKSLVSQALIDATKAIMEADEKKKMLLEPELDETGFHKAAHAARKSGQSHFEFQGKKYPVTSKSHTEGMVPPEKIGGQILKKHDDKAAAKGHSSVVRPVEEEDEKKKDSPFNWKGKPSQLPKKPGELTGHEYKKTSTGDEYTKKYKKDDMKEEAHPDEKEDKALVKKMVKPSALKREEEKETHLSKHSMTNEKYVTPPEARKIADKEVHKHEKSMHKGKKETDFDEERHMTPGEKEKDEKPPFDGPYTKVGNKKDEFGNEIKDKNMARHLAKKGMKGFKERYGKRAKNVMYATDTKQSMKEQQEIYTEAFDELDVLEEGKMDKMSLSALWHKHAQHTYGADQGYGAGMGGHHSHHAATAIENHVRKHHGNKCADDMCDHSDHHVSHAEYAGPKESEYHEKEAAKLRARHGIKGEIHGMHESLQLEDIGGISTISEKKKKVEMKEDEHVRVDGETDMNTKTVDGLRGRMKVPADYHNKSKSYKVALTVGEETEIEEGMMDTMKKVGGKVLKKLGHGSDEDMRKDLQRKMGVPQTGKKPKNEEYELDEANKESKKDFDARQARLAAASKETAKDPMRLKRLSSIPGYTAAMNLAKKTTKEEVELDEELHPEADKVLKHIKPEHHAKYKPDLAKGVYKGDYADRSAVLKAAQNAGHLKEEVEIDELSKKTLSSYMDKAKDRYVKHASSTGLGGSDEKRDSDNKKSIKYAQNMLKAKNKMEEVEEAFKGPEAGSGTGDHPFVTNENSPMNLAKELAKKSFKKIKQETMMGKISGGI